MHTDPATVTAVLLGLSGVLTVAGFAVFVWWENHRDR